MSLVYDQFFDATTLDSLFDTYRDYQSKQNFIEIKNLLFKKREGNYFFKKNLYCCYCQIICFNNFGGLIIGNKNYYFLEEQQPTSLKRKAESAEKVSRKVGFYYNGCFFRL